MFRYYTAIIFLSIVAMFAVQLGINGSHTLTKSRKKLCYMRHSNVYPVCLVLSIM